MQSGKTLPSMRSEQRIQIGSQRLAICTKNLLQMPQTQTELLRLSREVLVDRAGHTIFHEKFALQVEPL